MMLLPKLYLAEDAEGEGAVFERRNNPSILEGVSFDYEDLLL